jgi:hypothetical protein
MLFDNIIEKRVVNNGQHSAILEISASDYNQVYDEYNNELATEIIKHHLVNRGDDGRVSDVQIKHEEQSDIIRIYAKINYLGNDHTGYGIH